MQVYNQQPFVYITWASLNLLYILKLPPATFKTTFCLHAIWASFILLTLCYTLYEYQNIIYNVTCLVTVLDDDMANIQVDDTQVADIQIADIQVADIDYIGYMVARTLCCVSHKWYINKYLLCCPLGSFSSLFNSI